VKEAVFSFDRFAGLDPVLGPEMKSTGEAIGIGATFGEAFAKAHEGHPNVVDHMRTGRIQLLINTPSGRYSQIGDEDMRTEAVSRKITYTTTTSAAAAAVHGIRYLKAGEVEVNSLPKTHFFDVSA
jgi:carbamoyl-phosphate synthase large subunit